MQEEVARAALEAVLRLQALSKVELAAQGLPYLHQVHRLFMLRAVLVVDQLLV